MPVCRARFVGAGVLLEVIWSLGMCRRNGNQGGGAGYSDERVLFFCEALLAAETPLGCPSWGQVDLLLRDNLGGFFEATHYSFVST